VRRYLLRSRHENRLAERSWQMCLDGLSVTKHRRGQLPIELRLRI
jgi:hypothetical protein